MDVLRSVLLVVHLTTLAGLLLGLLAVLTGFAPPLLRTAIGTGAVVMGLSGVALVGVRSALDLAIDPAKIVVKLLVLVGIVVLARRLGRSDDPAGRRSHRRVGGAMAGLVLADVAIAVAWN